MANRIEVSSKIKEAVPETEIIACPLRFGDVLRMYAERSVTSSWKIGGAATTYKIAGLVYTDQLNDSYLLYENPLLLYNKYKARYFLFEKSRLNKIQNHLSSFTLLFQTKNLVLYEYSRVN